MNIFILEDETHMRPRSAILEALEGHNIVLGTHATHGIEVYCQNVPLGGFDVWLLDFDMHGNYGNKDMPECGYQFLRKLFKLKTPKGKPRIILHSQNAQGRKDMRDFLAENGHTQNVEERPFDSRYASWLRKEFPLAR